MSETSGITAGAPEPTPTVSAPAAAPAAAPVPTEAPSEGLTNMSISDTAPPAPQPGGTPAVDTPTPTTEPTPAPKPASETAAPSAAPAADAVATPTKPILATTPASGKAAPAATSTAQPDSKEEVEPQNALTGKFTPAEWKALKEFRDKIPAIVTDAYSDSPADKKPTTLDLWGVPIHPDVKDARTSVILMKFLRARNLNPTSAGEMLTATIRWRAIFKVDEAVKEEFPEKVFGSLAHISGVDREGRPVVYNLYGANKDLQAVFGDVQRFLRWRVKLMEECVTRLDFSTVDQMVQVHDYAGVSMRDRDANSKNAASEATSIFQNHYPEFLSRKFFINVPSLLSWIFWLFKSLVAARTFAKMSVVGSGHHEIKKALSEVIDENQIPKRYGGLADGF
ncbi:hypothetical protein HWV62_22299 [Athelia sp. TMB]|nr:hypothetical protein HWV62_22299 [Athelia sp. TMB]